MDMRKRELAGRFIANKRAKNALYSSTATKVASAQCLVSKYTNKPLYPGPGAVANNEPPAVPPPSLEAFYQTATYWAVPTTPPNCGAPGWQFMSTNEIGTYMTPWELGGNKGKSVNVDHVCKYLPFFRAMQVELIPLIDEVSLLDEFFTAQVDAGFTCGDISKLFDVPDTAAAGGTRLNTIFAQLPSLINPDFVGMDSALNRLKGALWNPDLTGVNLNMANTNAGIQALSNLAVVMAMANNEAISKLFSNTNARIYQAFQGIDLLIGASQDCSNPDDKEDRQPASTWASAYSVWMTGKIKSQNDMITKTASQISAAIPTDPANVKPNQVGQVKNWKAFIENFNAVYKVDALTFPQPDSWPQNAINIAKRQDASPACTGAPSANPSASVTATSADLSSTVTSFPISRSPASSPTITSAAVSTTIAAPIASFTFSCTTL